MDSESVFSRVGIVGIAPAGQGGAGSPANRTAGPPGSELRVSEHGAKNRITSDPIIVYDWVDISQGKEKVRIGTEKEIRMQGIGSPNLKLHAATDINVKLTGVHVTEIIEFNLFSLHGSQSRPIITLENDGVHLFNKQMAFPRRETSSCLHDTRIAPTPILKTAFTAVLAKFGSDLPPPYEIYVDTFIVRRQRLRRSVVRANVSH